MNPNPPTIALLGCGAISERYYAPALKTLEQAQQLSVTALFDPNAERVAVLQKAFPGAQKLLNLAQPPGTDLAIVASPARFHAEQTIQLLRHGVGVLCEKPMAATVEEGEAMINVAQAAQKILAVGLFRRFFPAAQTIYDLLKTEALGPVRSFDFREGGSFGWPAQSASFFQKKSAGGGVFLDIGVHVLDLMLWWFGDPQGVRYADDAMGGLEANCRLDLTYPGGVTGQVRLSRDWGLANRYVIQCEKGWLGWRVGEADQVEIGYHGQTYALSGHIQHPHVQGGLPALGPAAPTYSQSFIRQIQNWVCAYRGEEPIFVSGAEGLRSLKLIEQCYRERTLLSMPWFSDAEALQARALSTAS
ncbi:Gfo/Idh/MocA family protein [Anthocerotibacter panamensis]|uniref:Gfo/Idh/MocA family protein n=1 Tax=Anthocerotibacter panamensis TaxID=2857077 RepID=UPI001C404C65|nr:Gfo/Idh/MocA family oxidoreductase [Anthocerotibacter panamensis]